MMFIVGPITKQFKDEPVYLNRSTEEGREASEKAWRSLIPSMKMTFMHCWLSSVI